LWTASAELSLASFMSGYPLDPAIKVSRSREARFVVVRRNTQRNCTSIEIGSVHFFSAVRCFLWFYSNIAKVRIWIKSRSFPCSWARVITPTSLFFKRL
jgi:hypothetical protein